MEEYIEPNYYYDEEFGERLFSIRTKCPKYNPFFSIFFEHDNRLSDRKIKCDIREKDLPIELCKQFKKPIKFDFMTKWIWNIFLIVILWEILKYFPLFIQKYILK